MSSGKKCGIVGLPNIGKSTLFNSIMEEQIAKVGNYAFCTINPNIKKKEVEDERLKILAKEYKSEKIIPTHLEIYDIAGLVKGASEGEGLGNKFLGNILEVDLIIHVVKLFREEGEEEIDPIKDFEIVETELFLWDGKRLEEMYNKNKKNPSELENIKKSLEKVENFIYPEKNLLPLITSKPIIVLGNGEDILLKEKMEKFCEKKNIAFFSFNFLDSNRKNFEKLIFHAYSVLNLISFFTCGPKETRAWTIKKGTTYKEAAGEIHSDIKNKFICAHVIPWGEKKSIMKKANDLVSDGDTIIFKF